MPLGCGAVRNGRWRTGNRTIPAAALLGMLAFGCEESGDYRLTETHGRQPLELEPRNAWADDNALAIHNWWHLALFHLDQGESDAALALFDGPIHGQRSTVTVDLIDASSLLSQVQLPGGGRA